MVDRAWQRLRTIAALRTDRAGAAHGRALRAATDAVNALEAADAALVDAVAAWQRQMTDRFDPALGAAYAHLLTDRANARTAASDHRLTASDTTARAADAWRREQARSDAIDRQAETAGRHARRHADERALMAIADREVLKWTRR